MDGATNATDDDAPEGSERLAVRVEAACADVDSKSEPSAPASRLSGGSPDPDPDPDPDKRTIADGTSGADRFLEERALAEAPVGVTIAEAGENRPLIYVNDNFEALTGYPEAEVLGRNCRFLQGPETDDAAVEEMRAALNEGREVEVEVLNYRRDGTTFWNEVTIAPVHDDGGALTHFVGFQSDITKRKEAEMALAAEHEHLEHVLDRMNGLLGDITDTLVAAASREEVERAVCERLAGADPYAFA
ncbi:PAS domain-containing protein, partial [Halobium palmae]